jgi:hypothetical protein
LYRYTQARRTTAAAAAGAAGGDGDDGRSTGGGSSPTTTTSHVAASGDDDAPAPDALGDGEGVVFFDLCSGKGFTSILLAHRYPKARVLMFDKNEKMNLSHLDAPSLGNRVTFHAADLYADDTAALMRDAVVGGGCTSCESS